MTPVVALAGSLGLHARALTLTTILGGVKGEPPEVGIALAFAKDFQGNEEVASSWLGWCDQPGRLLLLLPPFNKGNCRWPVTWEARRTDPLAGAETELGRLLARERQHDLRGGLMPMDRNAGHVLTAAWRRHPLAGLFVVTALPVWSLLSLDHRGTVRGWLSDLYDQAGSPSPKEVAEAPATEALDGEDWSLLLYLASTSFTTAEAALEALGDSEQFKLAPQSALASMKRLMRGGLVDGGRLTTRGESALIASPYAAWFREIRRMRHAR